MDRQHESTNPVEMIAEACGGTVKEVAHLPDGSGFAVVSFPLPKDHWIYRKDLTPAGFSANVPPMPFRMGAAADAMVCIGDPETRSLSLIKTLSREQFAHAVRQAGKYAVRCATMNGQEMDFDPDALIQNLVVAMLGYWTKDGLTSDPEDAVWCDPQAPFDFNPPPRTFPQNIENSATAPQPEE